MFEYVDCNKVKDKLLLALICIVFFAFLYSVVERSEINYDNSDIFQSLLHSFSVQMFQYNIKDIYGVAFVFTIIQIVLSYIIIIA